MIAIARDTTSPPAQRASDEIQTYIFHHSTAEGCTRYNQLLKFNLDADKDHLYL